MATVGKVVSRISGSPGTPGYGVHYFLLAGTVPTVAEVNDVSGRVRAMWNAVAAYLANACFVTVDPTVVSYDVASGQVLGQTSGTPTAVVSGTGTNALPQANQLGLQLQTNTVANRRLLQGRTFLGPLGTNAQTSTGGPAAAARTAVITGGTALLSGATSAQLVVWSRPKPLGIQGAYGLVTSVDAAITMWVLRSRRD